ncbi:hypothetical protein M422DRAFT_71237 [Sphaerobolus stellatus SS14]|uniref:Potassium channel domain-containing protein n=1 Tax=Sphaerobolus stellatus (strain SS14) TaxID=990650 RepID=A0A0C9UVP3_SPHS4|nr:hypothetical protein M422DRAFT_71237 [Sphaerobolus stellatus SS14]
MSGALPIIIPIIQKLTEQPLSDSPSDDTSGDKGADGLGYSHSDDPSGGYHPRFSPNPDRKDLRFRSFPSNSTWSSELDYKSSRKCNPFRNIWNFILQHNPGGIDTKTPEEFIPNYRWLPILSGVTMPVSLLLQIPGCTERWYVRTLDNQTVQSKPNPSILLAANILAMVAALIANMSLIWRFLERRVKQMTIISLCFLFIHDIINIVTVTIFGIEHRFNDGFTYGQAYWLVVASTVVSLFTTVTLMWDLWTTPQFAKSGSGITRKQRSLVVIVMILLCWITFGGLMNSVLLHLTFIDGLYFTIVSIETIGFGDIHPNSTGSRIFAMIYNSVGIINIGLAISTARETIIESFETSYRRRVSEVAAKRLEYKKHKERERARKMVMERMLHSAGLPLYIPDPTRPSKMKLNEEALTPAQLAAAENEAHHMMSRRPHSASTRESRFERTFSLESSKDSYNTEFDEENYKNFRRSIVKEERREFAAKIAVAWIIFLTFWLIGAGIFTATEKWSYGIALYFCFIAFTSIGYGDYSPATPAGRSVFVVWALMGVGAMTILISVLCEAGSSRYKNALSKGSFARAVKNFRERRATSPSPHTTSYRFHSRSRSREMSPDRDYTHEHAKRDLEALPGDLLNHAKAFHEHIYYFLNGVDGSEAPPPTLQRLLEEVAESEHMDDALKSEIMEDEGARKALFMMSYEGALRKMIKTAERAVAILSRRDFIGNSRDKDSISHMSKSSVDPGQARQTLDLDNQRYNKRPTPKSTEDFVVEEVEDEDIGSSQKDRDSPIEEKVQFSEV